MTRRSSPDHAKIASSRCPSELAAWSLSNSHHPSSEGTFFVAAPSGALFKRWIEAKTDVDGKSLGRLCSRQAQQHRTMELSVRFTKS